MLFLSSISFAAAPVISPSTPTVFVSSNVIITADQNVTYSLMPGSTGTLSNVFASSVTYNAPGPIRARGVFLGCQNFPNDSIWHTPITNAPILTSSNTYFHAQVDGAPIGIEVSFPENMYTLTTPTTNMVFANSGVNGSYPMADWPKLQVEAGEFTDSRQVDQHILSMNKDTCQATEIYKYFPVGQPGSGTCGAGNCNSGSGVQFTNSYARPQGVDAAGLPVTVLSDTYEDIYKCVNLGIPITHPMRFTLSNGILAASHIYPATAQATPGGQLPYGTWIRLKSSVSISTYSAVAQCVLQQAKDFGAIAADGGSNMHLQFMSDVGAEYSYFKAIAEDLGNLNNIWAQNFEVIDVSSLQDTDANSPTFHTSRVASTNTIVAPFTSAVIVASNTVTHLSSFMPMIIQPVTIGTEHITGYNFFPGTPGTQLNIWVHGAVDTSFSCSMSPTLGALTSGGIYTPPSTNLTRSSTTVTCGATADPSNAKIQFPIFVYTSTAARLSLSEDTNVDYGPDVNGNTWYADRGSYWRWMGDANCDFSDLPTNPWSAGLPDRALYYHCQYINNGSGDLFYRFFVPNGTYKITMLFGIGGTSAFSRGTWQMQFDSQGQIYTGSSATTLTGFGPWAAQSITGKLVDVCDIVGSCANVTPGSVIINSTVTDNTLYVALRHLAPNGVAQPASVLTALSIEQTSVSGTSSFQTQGFGGRWSRSGTFKSQ